jgi:hypothetical protein
MTKVGLNPDFADWDEMDLDALEIVEEFYDGTVSFDELKAIVGTDAAQSIIDRMTEDGYDTAELFDNPEYF